MEPERKIEKLLRAFARKRRADAGNAFVLHPATRRMLQDEAARQSAKPPAEPESLSLWDLFRERWAVLLGFALITFLCATLFWPAVSKTKDRASQAETADKLKQIGAAAQLAAADNNRKLPATLDGLTNHIASRLILTDSISGKPFVYAAGGAAMDKLQSSNVLAYSPNAKDRSALFADGSVRRVRREEFGELTNGTSPLLAVTESGVTPAPAKAAAPPAPATAPALVTESAALPPPAAAPGASGGGIATATPAASRSTSAPAGMISKGGPVAAKSGPMTGTLAVAGQTMERDQAVLSQNVFKFKAEQGAANGSAMANNSQRYQQIANKKLPALLNTFEVQQNGSQLAVVDQDGSVYSGSVEPVPVVAKEDLGGAKGAAVKPGASDLFQNRFGLANNQSAAQNYFFRVSGANRSLKQNVVFTGNIVADQTASYVQAPNGTQQMVAQNAAAPDAAQNFSNGIAAQSRREPKDIGQQQMGQSSLFSNARIMGTVTIDRTNKIEIDALPVTP
ncbi:MAG TPA: hypothetical protein VF988_08935 [Verrucomicrobiae bacterium]